MIRDKLISLLEQNFGTGAFTIGTVPNLIVSFPSAHSEVGELKILDDGNEVIIIIGEITHGHFGSINVTATREEIEEEIVENVIEFIQDLFDDKYIFWRTKQIGVGGWMHVDFMSENDRKNNAVYFTWSGPLPLGNESSVP